MSPFFLWYILYYILFINTIYNLQSTILPRYPPMPSAPSTLPTRAGRREQNFHLVWLMVDIRMSWTCSHCPGPVGVTLESVSRKRLRIPNTNSIFYNPLKLLKYLLSGVRENRHLQTGQAAVGGSQGAGGILHYSLC